MPSEYTGGKKNQLDYSPELESHLDRLPVSDLPMDSSRASVGEMEDFQHVKPYCVQRHSQKSCESRCTGTSASHETIPTFRTRRNDTPYTSTYPDTTMDNTTQLVGLKSNEADNSERFDNSKSFREPSNDSKWRTDRMSSNEINLFKAAAYEQASRNSLSDRGGGELSPQHIKTYHTIVTPNAGSRSNIHADASVTENVRESRLSQVSCRDVIRECYCTTPNTAVAETKAKQSIFEITHTISVRSPDERTLMNSRVSLPLEAESHETHRSALPYRVSTGERYTHMENSPGVNKDPLDQTELFQRRVSSTTARSFYERNSIGDNSRIDRSSSLKAQRPQYEEVKNVNDEDEERPCYFCFRRRKKRVETKIYTESPASQFTDARIYSNERSQLSNEEHAEHAPLFARPMTANIERSSIINTPIPVRAESRYEDLSGDFYGENIDKYRRSKSPAIRAVEGPSPVESAEWSQRASFQEQSKTSSFKNADIDGQLYSKRSRVAGSSNDYPDPRGSFIRPEYSQYETAPRKCADRLYPEQTVDVGSCSACQCPLCINPFAQLTYIHHIPAHCFGGLGGPCCCEQSAAVIPVQPACQCCQPLAWSNQSVHKNASCCVKCSNWGPNPNRGHALDNVRRSRLCAFARYNA